MSLLLKNNCKRKSRGSSSSSQSSIESITSPENKKMKDNNEVKAPIEEHEDEVKTAFNMTEDITAKLNKILIKVDNLDQISTSVKKIEHSLQKLEERMSMMEDFKDETTKQLQEMEEGAKHFERCTEEKFQDTNVKLQKAKEKLEKLEEERSKMQSSLNETKSEIESLKTKDLYLEAYSRRENIIFRNIEETPWEDTEKKLRAFLNEKLNYKDYDKVEIQRVHRNPSKSNPRPIIARFLRYKDCESILALGKNLKGTNFSMYTDLPLEIVKRRKTQMVTLKKAKANNIPAAFSKAKPDKLYIRGKEWPVGQELII